MNKFSDHEGSLEEYTKRLEDVKRKLSEQMRDFPTSVKTEPPISNNKEIFASHPRNCIGSSSTESSSPRHSISVDSCTTTKASILMVIESSHTKTFKKWTNPSRPLSVPPQQFDIDIGDCYDNSSIKSFKIEDIKKELKMFYNKYQQKTSTSISTTVGSQNVPKHVPKVMDDATFEKKLKAFVEKSVQSIGFIRDLMEKGIEPPDGEIDISKRMLRVKEFSNRFSRNYLYPLVRQIDEFSKWRSLHQGSTQKLLSAYQLVYNGLQAYQNHFPTSIGTCSSDKLKLLMKHLLEICDIHCKLLPEENELTYREFLITFKSNADLILKTIDYHFNPNASLRPSMTHFRTETKLLKQRKPKKIQERLYMYNSTSSFRREPMWRMAAKALSREKNKNIKSRYKTAGFKHRPPIVRTKTELNSVLESQSKLSNKKSSVIFKKEMIHNSYNDDEIATMIQMEDENDKNDENDEKQDDNDQQIVDVEEIVLKLLQLVVDINARKTENNNETIKKNKTMDKILDILDKVKKGVDCVSLKDLLKDLQSEGIFRETLELKIVQSSESMPNLSTPNKSPIQIDEGPVKNEKNNSVKKHNMSFNRKHSEKETKSKPPTLLSANKTKPTKYLQMLPKDYAMNIIQYKLDFRKHCKGNPMYKANAKILPWELLDSLSEKILNIILLAVTKEVEISEVVEKIYQSELQFC